MWRWNKRPAEIAPARISAFRQVGSIMVCVVFLGAVLRVQEGRAQPFVEAVQGDYPLILSAPHGGYLTPDSLRDRSCGACITGRDTRTQEWARLLSDEIFLLRGRRPYYVLNLLARIKLDANRDLPEATDGDVGAAGAWGDYHGALDDASADVTARFGAGLVLDLHGHGHTIARFELGYLLSAATLRLADGSLNARRAQSSLSSLASQATPFSTLIRGSESLGEFLQRQGVAATPSLTDQAPQPGEPFFSGGYITARHGSRDGGTVDAIQLEAYYSGARNSDDNVAQLAKEVARAVVSYMDRWYGDAVGTATRPQTALPSQPECLTASTRSGAVWFEVAAECHLGDVTVSLSDVLGRKVGHVRVRGRGQIDTRQLPAGVYFAFTDRLPEAMPVVVR